MTTKEKIGFPMAGAGAIAIVIGMIKIENGNSKNLPVGMIIGGVLFVIVGLGVATT